MQPQGGTNKNKTMQLKGMRIFHCGKYTTSGGQTLEEIAIDGVRGTDLVFCQVFGNSSGLFGLTAICDTDKVTVTFASDPGDDTGIYILVLRP